MYVPDFFKLSTAWSRFFFDQRVAHFYSSNISNPQAYNCFYKTPLETLKVIVLGSKPYKNSERNTGLAYEVPFGSLLSSSLVHLYNKLEQEGFYPSRDGSMESLTKQGVLFMNLELFENSVEFSAEILKYIHNYNPNIICVCMTDESKEFMNAFPFKFTLLDYHTDDVFQKLNKMLLNLYNKKLII